MAVTAPTPPTPPTPPKVPSVTLQEGGTVKETTTPQSHGPQSDEERNEAQARQAVAQGDGALSKTTVGDQEKKSTDGKQAQTEKGAKTGGTVTEKNTEERDAQIEALLKEQGDGQGENQQAVTKEPPPVIGVHGPVYWGISVISMLAVAVALYQYFKKKQKMGKSADDVEIHAGMKASEVLEKLEARERRTAVPQAMKEYRVQAEAKPEKKQAAPLKGKDTAPAPKIARLSQKGDKTEEKHFEVRI